MFHCRRIAPVVVVLLVGSAVARAESQPATKPIRIGAVAYAPSAVTIFNGIKAYLNRHGLAADYVLYSNYDSLVDGLVNGEVDIAWNTPLAHAQCHLRLKEQSQTLVMRDVDKDFRAVLVARRDRPVHSPKDLPGRTIVLGSHDAAEATVLPRYYLKQSGVDFAKLKVVDLDQELDFEGNPCSSEHDVLKALRDGRADAGVIGERLWKAIETDKNDGAADLRLIWTSPPFTHCVFTARPDFDPEIGNQFRSLMLAMTPDQPSCADVLRLEGTRKWIAGSHDGFKDLIEALQSKADDQSAAANASTARD